MKNTLKIELTKEQKNIQKEIEVLEYHFRIEKKKLELKFLILGEKQAIFKGYFPEEE